MAVMACRSRVGVSPEEAVEVVGTREEGGRYDRARSWLLAYRGSGGVPLLRDVGGVNSNPPPSRPLAELEWSWHLIEHPTRARGHL